VQTDTQREFSPQPSSKKKYAFVAAIIIIAVIGLALTAFFIASRYYSTPKSGTPDWETYRNSTYEFSVEHPRDWNVLTEEPVYISPLGFQGYEVDSKRDFFGFSVERFSSFDSAALEGIIDTEMRAYKLGYSDGRVEITQDSATDSYKLEYGPYKKPNGELLYESVVYWLVGGNSVLRIAYDYPIEEQNTYRPVFEEIFTAFIFAGQPVDVTFDFSGPKEAYFNLQPRSGSLVPLDDPSDSQYRLGGSAYTDDYTQHIYYYCPNNEANLDDCARINIIENYNESYEAEKNALLNSSNSGLYDYMLERTFSFEDSEGVIVYAYNKNKPGEDGPFEGWLYLNRDGHLFKIASSHNNEFLSNPKNFLDLLNSLEVAP